jgi:hypothetical protein
MKLKGLLNIAACLLRLPLWCRGVALGKGCC